MAKASKDTKSTATSKVKGTKKPSKTPATSREIIEKAVKQGKVDVKAKAAPKTPAKPASNGKAVANGKSRPSKKSSSEESSESSSDEEEKPKVAQVKAFAKLATPESDESESEDEKPAPKLVPKPKLVSKVAGRAPLPSKQESSDEDSDSSEESDEETAKLGQKKKPPPPRKQSESESSDSDSEDEAKPVPPPILSKSVLKKAPSSSDSSESSESESDKETTKPSKVESPCSSDSDSDSEEGPPKAAKAVPVKSAPTKKAESSGEDDSSSSEDDSNDSSSSDDDDGDVKMTDVSTKPKVAAVGGAQKRKAQDEGQPQSKKTKIDNDAAAPTGGAQESTTIFVGRLSWSVDNDRLAQEFAECGEIESAHVQTDRDTGKSRGFGYVRFKTAGAVEKALAMNGTEIDGRAVNIDRSSQQDRTQIREKRAKAFGDEVSPPSSVLFVGNLSFSTTEDTVWEFFNEYGVKTVRLPTDRDTGRPKGYGYVEFEDLEGAKKAFEASTSAEIDGRNVRLDYSQPRDSNNFGGRGGGRGGRGGGDRGGRGGYDRGGRGGYDRGGRGGYDRGGRGGYDRGGRGGGDRGGRGGGRGGRGFQRGGPRRGIPPPEGKKITF